MPFTRVTGGLYASPSSVFLKNGTTINTPILIVHTQFDGNISGYHNSPKGHCLIHIPNHQLHQDWCQCIFALLHRGSGYPHDKVGPKHNPPGVLVVEKHNDLLPPNDVKGFHQGPFHTYFQYGNYALIPSTHAGF